MSANFDPSSDLADVADGTETVTLYRRGTTPGSPGTTLVGALRQAVRTREARSRNRGNTWKEIASGGQYTAGDVLWHLPQGQLAESPRLGDLIVDADARRWTILETIDSALQTRWRCIARNLAIAHGLDDTVTILRATYAKGTGGAAEPTWGVWKTGVRARIQPAEARVTTRHLARRTDSRFQILLEEDVPLDHTHRIQGPDGVLYRINSSNNTGRIGELQTVDATRWSDSP